MMHANRDAVENDMRRKGSKEQERYLTKRKLR